MEQILDEYALVDAQIKALEVKKEQLRPHITKLMIAQGTKKIEIAAGNFTLGSTKIWTYPEVILELGEELKSAKAKAESTGEATFEEKPRLTFTSLKL